MMTKEIVKKSSLLSLGLIIFSIGVTAAQSDSLGAGICLAIIGLAAIVISQHYHVDSEEFKELKTELESLKKEE